MERLVDHRNCAVGSLRLLVLQGNYNIIGHRTCAVEALVSSAGSF